MVNLIVKKSEQVLFLHKTTTQTQTSALISTLITIQNKRLLLTRLVSAVKDLVEHGEMKPVETHGYSEEEISTFAASSEQPKKVPSIVDGREVLLNPDPTGRRNGVAPSQEMALVIEKTVANAERVLSTDHVDKGIELTMEELEEAVNEIKGALMIVWPMGLKDYEPAREILDVLDKDATLWWANKQILPGKVLSDFIGKNEKTKLIVKIQNKGQGQPVREAPLDERAQKEMMSYYYRKQEEHKRLMENEEDDYLNSPWADGKSLKAAFNGLGNIGFKPK